MLFKIVPPFHGEWHAAALGEIYKIRMTEIFGSAAKMEQAYNEHVAQPSPRNAWAIADSEVVRDIGKKCADFLPSERAKLMAVRFE